LRFPASSWDYLVVALISPDGKPEVLGKSLDVGDTLLFSHCNFPQVAWLERAGYLELSCSLD
jgi:hypothetical protein